MDLTKFTEAYPRFLLLLKDRGNKAISPFCLEFRNTDDLFIIFVFYLKTAH